MKPRIITVLNDGVLLAKFAVDGPIELTDRAAEYITFTDDGPSYPDDMTPATIDLCDGTVHINGHGKRVVMLIERGPAWEYKH